MAATDLFGVTSSQTRSINDFSGATFTDKMNSWIAAVNAGDGVACHVPGSADEYYVEGQLDEITGNRWGLLGDGFATMIHVDSTAGTLANFLRFGTSGTRSDQGVVANFRFQLDNASPSSTQYLFEYDNCTAIVVRDLFVQNISGLARFGTSSNLTSRCDIRQVRGNCSSSLTTDGIVRLTQGAQTRVTDIVLADGEADTRTGSFVKIAPNGGPVDTVFLERCSFQSFSTSTPADTPPTDGKPVGLEIDLDNEKAVNLFCDRCIFDHTTTAGVWVHGTSDNDLTVLKVSNSRISTDGGKGVLIEHGASVNWRDIAIRENHIIIDDNSPAVDITETGDGEYHDCALEQNTISESNASLSKDRAIYFRANGGWKISDNQPKQRTGSIHGFQTGLEITSTALSRFMCNDNDFSDVDGLGITHASYASPDVTRQFLHNMGPDGLEYAPPPGWLELSTTPTWTGTAAPTGGNLEFTWKQDPITGWVSVIFRLAYGSAGTALTALTVPFPSTLPTPELPGGYANTNVYVPANGSLVTALDSNPADCRSWIETNSGGTFILRILETSGDDYQMAMAHVDYPAAALT